MAARGEKPMDEFAHKVALITGAGGGIGREITLAFASLGVSVAANDINPLRLDETVNQVLQAGGTARPYIFDVAKRMPIEGMMAQVLENFGRIDILVNHAGVQPDASLLDMDEWEFHRTLDVNLGGPFFCMQQVGRVMQQQGGGSIVNLISFAGWKQFHKGHTAHSASQVGLLGLTQAAAIELEPYHIRVNAVCFGSSMMSITPPSVLDTTQVNAWREMHSQMKLGDHPDLVSLVLYLCTPGAESLNGQIITINNGQQL